MGTTSTSHNQSHYGILDPIVCNVCKRVDLRWCTSAKKGGSSVAPVCKRGILVVIKRFLLTAVLLSCQSLQGRPPARAGVQTDHSASSCCSDGLSIIHLCDVQHVQLPGWPASVSKNRNKSVFAVQIGQFEKYCTIAGWNRPDSWLSA